MSVAIDVSQPQVGAEAINVMTGVCVPALTRSLGSRGNGVKRRCKRM